MLPKRRRSRRRFSLSPISPCNVSLPILSGACPGQQAAGLRCLLLHILQHKPYSRGLLKVAAVFLVSQTTLNSSPPFSIFDEPSPACESCCCAYDPCILSAPTGLNLSKLALSSACVVGGQAQGCGSGPSSGCYSCWAGRAPSPRRLPSQQAGRLSRTTSMRTRTSSQISIGKRLTSRGGWRWTLDHRGSTCPW